jgi:tetratricopeptide (TPR) repeat protein
MVGVDMTYGRAGDMVGGVLVMAFAAVASFAPTNESPTAAQRKSDYVASMKSIAAEDWALCTSDPTIARLDTDYANGIKAIEAQAWDVAIRLLNSAALRDTRNADVHDYLGYAYQGAGQLGAALEHYNKALTLNPRHRGAHRHLGEAHLMAGNTAKVEEHLAALERICLIPCEEYAGLKRELGVHGTR